MVLRRRVVKGPAGESPRVTPPTASEIEWRDKQVQVACLLATRYTGATEPVPSLDRLDAVVSGWQGDDETRVDINSVINGVGIAMGHHVSAAAKLEWVIATDAQGSDLALHGQPSDVLIFPANATAKRLVAGEQRFVRTMHDALVAGVEDRRRLG